MAAALCIVLGRVAAAPRRRSGKPEPREAGGGIEADAAAAAAESTRFLTGFGEVVPCARFGGALCSGEAQAVSLACGADGARGTHLQWAGGSDVGLDRIAAPWSATNSCRWQTSRPCGPNRSAPETPGERACCGRFEGKAEMWTRTHKQTGSYQQNF